MVAAPAYLAPDVHLRLVDTEDSRRRLIPFTRRMFPAYQPARHHALIAAQLEAIERGELDRLIVTMPPRHGKSTLASEHFPAWYLGRNPDKRIIACSHTAQLAYTFSRRARNIVTAPAYPFTVRLASDLSAVQSWDIAGTRGGYVAAGVGGPITGMGANVLLIDDPVKSAEEADSPTYREAAWEWWTGTARTRLEPGGAVVVIGTRWHEDDLIGRLLQSGHWDVLHLPALSEDDAALWPERFDLAALERIRTEIGSRNWEAQYQGRPSSAEGAILKREWWGWYRAGETPTFSRIVQAWDTAYKAGRSNDWSVCTTWGEAVNGYYLLDRYRARVEFP
nr:terminase family protein [Chloroflexota bacterium]